MKPKQPKTSDLSGLSLDLVMLEYQMQLATDDPVIRSIQDNQTSDEAWRIILEAGAVKRFADGIFHPDRFQEMAS